MDQPAAQRLERYRAEKKTEAAKRSEIFLHRVGIESYRLRGIEGY